MCVWWYVQCCTYTELGAYWTISHSGVVVCAIESLLVLTSFCLSAARLEFVEVRVHVIVYALDGLGIKWFEAFYKMYQLHRAESSFCVHMSW